MALAKEARVAQLRDNIPEELRAPSMVVLERGKGTF